MAFAVLAVAVSCVPSAGAAGTQTGTLIVRLVTDPSPPGVSWSYSGAGTTFKLGVGASEKVLSTLQPGSYRIAEAPANPAQPPSIAGLTCSDPSHDTTVDRASGTATVALAADETVVCTFTHRALGPRPGAAALQLATRFAPVLHLGAREKFRPLRIQDYLANTVLRSGSPPHGTTTQAHPTLFSLPITTTPFYLDIRDAEPSSQASRYPLIEERVRLAHPRATVYWRITRQASTGRTAIEYWFLYLYNDFLDRHEADWEGVTVFLQGDTPLGAAYSQHQGRSWVSWPTSPAGDHPALYVAAGSHAGYPRAGAYRVRVCWTLHGRHCTLTRKTDSALGDGTTLAPSTYDLHEFGGTGYTGGWGSGTTIAGIGRTSDRVTDPRRRAEYSNPFTVVPLHP